MEYTGKTKMLTYGPAVHITPKKFENGASILRLGLPFTLIRHEIERSFSKTFLLKSEGIWKRRLCENDKVAMTTVMIPCLSFNDRRLLSFHVSRSLLSTEHIWCVPAEWNLRFQNPPTYLWTRLKQQVDIFARATLKHKIYSTVQWKRS